MEGGFVYGRDAVREYWTKQLAEINQLIESGKLKTRVETVLPLA